MSVYKTLGGPELQILSNLRSLEIGVVMITHRTEVCMLFDAVCELFNGQLRPVSKGDLFARLTRYGLQ